VKSDINCYAASSGSYSSGDLGPKVFLLNINDDFHKERLVDLSGISVNYANAIGSASIYDDSDKLRTKLRTRNKMMKN
jgi:hypothetical protein